MTTIPAPLAGTVPAEFEGLDARFAGIRGDARLERLWTGGRWLEGPVYSPAGRYLLFSDIPNDRMLRWDETSYEVSVFRQPAGNTNGHTLDQQGRLVSCEHGTRRVTRTEHDGSVRVLADRWDGHRLNSPNDVVVHSDGSIWFTDPAYGIDSDYEGHKAESEIGASHLYSVDPRSGACRIAAGDFVRPNGLAFSPDEKKLYVVASRAEPRRQIVAYDVVDNGTKLTNGKVLIDAGPGGSPDGFRVDVEGNLWCGWGMGSDELDGVRVFNPEGKPIGHITLPERCANVCFGGRYRNRLFMAASHSLYSYYVNTQGAV